MPSLSTLLSLLLVAWFMLLAACEFVTAHSRSAPERSSSDGRLLTNFGLAVLAFIIAAILPVSRIGSSAIAEQLDVGIGHHLHLSWFALFALLFIVDSFAAYWVHRLMHVHRLLWRIHRVHHADTAVDVSTSLRNHPFEMAVSGPVAAAVVLVIGAPPSVVVAIQSLSVAASIWQHADIALPRRIDSKLALAIFTPRLHRLHHNPVRQIHDSNFGELISLWDRMFGTLNTSEERGAVGLENQSSAPDRLIQQIWSPLRA